MPRRVSRLGPCLSPQKQRAYDRKEIANAFPVDAVGKVRYSTLGELAWDDPVYAAAIRRLAGRR